MSADAYHPPQGELEAWGGGGGIWGPARPVRESHCLSRHDTQGANELENPRESPESSPIVNIVVGVHSCSLVLSETM